MNNLRLVTYVPMTHADRVREAIGKSGGGKIGNYSHCSFSSIGVGRFLPQKDARPRVGKLGVIAEVPEERIECYCKKSELKKIAKAIRKVHPYEEVPIDVSAVEIV